MERKYPGSLFWAGFALDVVVRRFFLFWPGIVFVIIGIWKGWALVLGAILIAVDVIVSLVNQLRNRHTMLNSDNPNFREVQNAALSPNWQKNIIEMVDEKIRDYREDDSE